MSKKIGLLFGIFNPVHNGHIDVGEIVMKEINFDEVWYLVTPFYNKKPENNLIKYSERINILNIATKNHPNLIVKDFEKKMSPPYYTIQTLNFLKKFNNSFSIIMGEDNFNNIETWKECEKILEEYKIIVYPRKNSSVKNNYQKSKSIIKIKNNFINVSSSYIVENFNNYRKIKNMINHQVYDYIKTTKCLNR